MRGREVFMASLEAHGVEAIFGNPGTTENPVLDSLAEHPAINYYVALHEGVAVGAAGFYAQASGKVGVANLHVAPGLGNAIGMLYGALKAGSPLVVTAGQQDTRMRLRDPILGHDLVAMAAPVTKWAVEARSADELGPILRRAFKLAQEPPTGPVFVALPIDVMEQETAVAATTAGILHARSNPDAAAIDKLAQLLAASRNPGIVAGDDVAVDGAGGALVALAERLGASVYVESLRARQPLPFNHANFRGRMPYAGGDIARLLAPHDVVVLIGGRFFEEVWFDDEPWLAPETLVVQIEAAPQRLAHNLPLDLGVLGAPAPVLAALGPALDDAWSDEVAARAAARQRELLARREREQQDLDRQLADATADRMNALRACVTVARTLPPRAILVDES
ncbi:MAG: thiamine pyrophosphate-binding protein, partial [Gammaproteobacteria bacterium]